MKLSIIVPVYNAEKWLRRCVESLLNQDIDKGEYEILLVDDGSTDGSLALAHQLAAEAGNIRVFTQPNAGPGAARNRGIDNAKGDYLMFVDADDYIKPNSLAPILDLAINKNLDLCMYKLIQICDSDEHSSKTKLHDYNLLSEGDIIHLPFGSACVCLYKKALINNYGIRFTSLHYDEDTLFMTEVLAHSNAVIDTQLPIYIYDLSMKPTDPASIINKQKERFLDSIIMAQKTKELSHSAKTHPKFKQFLAQRANSLVVSQVISVLTKRHVYGHSFVNHFMRVISKSTLYPIKGRTLSWKSTIAIPLVNRIIRHYSLSLINH